MAGVPAKRPATYEDLLEVPEHLVAEIIDGELITSPRPAARHALAATVLGSDVSSKFGRGDFGGPGGWVILFEPELHIVGQVLVPDISGWRRERLPEVPDAAYFELAPDWLCEVLSPSTAARDRTKKLHHYARAQVRHVWFIDPGVQPQEVFRLDGDGWRLALTATGSDKVRAEPFEATEIELAALWAV
jgi:Uma2 family endonuclease